MKRIGMLMLSLLISGCTMHYSKVAIPASPEHSSHYALLNHIKKSKSGIRVFTLGGSSPSAMELIKEVVQQEEGDGIINTEISFRETFIGPISIPYVLIEGDVVRVASQGDLDQSMAREDSANFISTPSKAEIKDVDEQSIKAKDASPGSTKQLNASKAEKRLSAKKPAARAARQDTTNYTFVTWKSFLISIENKPNIYNDWSLFQIRTQQNMNFKKWVASLTEQDFEQYKKSNLSAQDWLQDYWTTRGDESEIERINNKNVKKN